MMRMQPPIREPHFHFTPLGSEIADRTFLLFGDDGATIRAMGSGVFVGRELGLTAKHVMAGIWNELSRTPMPGGSERITASFRVFAVNFPGSQDMPAFWLVSDMWGAKYSDLAVLQLRPLTATRDKKYDAAILRLRALPPEVGDVVAAFGYPLSSVDAVSREPLELRWSIAPYTTQGVVTQVFAERRDRALLSFPCFEINARFEPGMSGGPIFNAQGHLCGIISAALTEISGPTRVAYGAALWPVFGTNIDFAGPGLIVGGFYPFFELRSVGYIAESGWDEVAKRVRIAHDVDGGEYLSLEE